MGRLKIRDYQKKDKFEIVELLKKGLTEKFNMDRWNWLHHNNVTLGSDIVVAEYDGKIVGTVGAIKKKFYYNEEIFVGGRHIDPVVDVSMRGKGVFFKMLGALNEMSTDVNFSYTFPNNPSFRGFSKFGYRPIGPIHIQSCQLSFAGSGIKEKLRYLNTGIKTAFKSSRTVKKADITSISNLKPEMPRNRFYLTRDYDYLNWRYAACPVKKYDILLFENHGKMMGSCIIYTENSNVSVLDIIPHDTGFDPVTILTGIKEIYGKVKIIYWSTGPKRLKSYFLGKGVQNFMILEGDMETPNRIYDIDSWYVTKGEVEGN